MYNLLQQISADITLLYYGFIKGTKTAPHSNLDVT